MSRLVGQRLGNYLVERLLGRGGMGEVYLARHPGIGKQVAIKVLRDATAQSEESAGRFFREARAVNQIRHENIVDIIDFGQTETGLAYFTMEYLEGESLAARIERLGALPLPQIVHIARQVCSALRAAHAIGIIHRDLKPENIFLTQREEKLFVKVLDFGVAKVLDNDLSVRTAHGVTVGTPRYMSPEQAMGHTVGSASDQYALGVILFEMASAQVPFEDTNGLRLATKHVHDVPPGLLQKNPNASPALARIVSRCLSKRPEDRYPSMEELDRALLALTPAASTQRVGAPVAAPTPAGRAGKWIAGALLLLVGVGGGVLLSQRNGEAPAPRQALPDPPAPHLVVAPPMPASAPEAPRLPASLPAPPASQPVSQPASAPKELPAKERPSLFPPKKPAASPSAGTVGAPVKKHREEAIINPFR